MKLRPYQQEFIGAVRDAWREHDRVLGVAATGAGKTILASELMREWPGNCLFLADAQQLVHQNADKYMTHSGDLFVGVEMAESHALPGDRVVVATAQSMARRLDKWPRNYFDMLIIDEAHRNTLGAMSKRVLDHFPAAKVLGVTATPWRSDRRQLGEFYQHIAIDIPLPRLIKEGYLSRIVIKSVPLNVDLRKVRTVAGDYNEADLGDAIAPHLEKAAALLLEHAADRRTVAFLPLVATSKEFVAACRRKGLDAIHVDGTDRAGVEAFARGRHQIISNAALLTTGWDQPDVSCVYILRPTKSLSLYQQMVGRGTRIADGKENLLLLDPLFLTEDHTLIKPARLIAKDKAEAKELSEHFDEAAGGGEMDLLETDAAVRQQRESKLAEKLKERAKRKAKTVDAMEFFLSVGAHAALEYEPEMKWEMEPVSAKQREVLERAGFDPDDISCKGKASKILDLLFTRRDLGLATPKQIKWLRQLGHPSPESATFAEASDFMNRCFGRRAGKGAA